MSEFCCICCGEHFINAEDASQHKCIPAFMMKNGVISFELSQVTGLKRTRWRRFQDRLLSLDIGWGFAFMGLVVMNCVLVRHINMTLTECFIESLSLGLVIPRILK